MFGKIIRSLVPRPHPAQICEKVSSDIAVPTLALCHQVHQM